MIIEMSSSMTTLLNSTKNVLVITKLIMGVYCIFTFLTFCSCNNKFLYSNIRHFYFGMLYFSLRSLDSSDGILIKIQVNGPKHHGSIPRKGKELLSFPKRYNSPGIHSAFYSLIGQ